MYIVFVRLDNGEFQQVASCKNLEQVVQFVKALKAEWPKEYAVKDSEGNYVDLTK